MRKVLKIFVPAVLCVLVLCLASGKQQAARLNDGTVLEFFRCEATNSFSSPTLSGFQRLLKRFVPARFHPMAGISTSASQCIAGWGSPTNKMLVFVHYSTKYFSGASGIDIIYDTPFVVLPPDGDNEHTAFPVLGIPRDERSAYLVCSMPFKSRFGKAVQLRICEKTRDEQTLAEFRVKNPEQ